MEGSWKVPHAAEPRLIARDEQVTSDLLLEGNWEYPGFVVIEEFTSMEHLKEFWFSPDYQEAIKLRDGKVKLDFVVAVNGQ